MRFLKIFALSFGILAAAQTQAADDLNARLRRIFSSSDFAAHHFGPIRWERGGSAYTTLEDSAIVEHDTATGKAEVLVTAAQLTPAGGKALEVDDYRWSADSSKLLIFTNTKKVWRLNTRGDYWVLDRRSGKLRKLGGRCPGVFSDVRQILARCRARGLCARE